jgi:hypothetical protein
VQDRLVKDVLIFCSARFHQYGTAHKLTRPTPKSVISEASAQTDPARNRRQDRVVNDVREYAASIGRPLSKDSVYNTFISCVQVSTAPLYPAFRSAALPAAL